MSLTPGPWHVFASEDDDVAPVIEVRDHFSRFVASINDTDDAELIAKAPIAPKLAEALRAIVKDLAANDEEGLIEHADAMAKARAALAEWDAQS